MPSRPPVFDHAARLPSWRRWGQGAATALAWAAYAYVWLPVLTAVGWWVAWRAFDTHVWAKAPLEDPFVLLTLPIIAATCGVLLVGWAEYNRRRFANADQRRRRPDATPEAVVEGLGATPTAAAVLRGARVCTVDLDDRARITHVAPGRAQDALPPPSA